MKALIIIFFLLIIPTALGTEYILEGTYTGDLREQKENREDWYRIYLKSGQLLFLEAEAIDYNTTSGGSGIKISLAGDALDYNGETFPTRKIRAGEDPEAFFYQAGSNNDTYTILIKVEYDYLAVGSNGTRIYYKLKTNLADRFDADSGKDAGSSVADSLEIKPEYYPNNWLGGANSDDNIDFFKSYVLAGQNITVNLNKKSEKGKLYLQMVKQNGGLLTNNSNFTESHFSSTGIGIVHASPLDNRYIYFSVRSNDSILYSLDVSVSGEPIEPIKHTQSKKCDDTDGGKNYIEKGTVEYNGTTYVDNCLTRQLLKEYYCDNGKQESGYNCNNKNQVCENGSCIAERIENITESEKPFEIEIPFNVVIAVLLIALSALLYIRFKKNYFSA